MSDTPSNNQQSGDQRFLESPQFLELLNSSLFYTGLKRTPLVQHITVSITGSQTIPHNLGKAPNVILVEPNAASLWYKTQASDASNIYLRAYKYIGSPAAVSDATDTFDITLMYLENNIN